MLNCGPLQQRYDCRPPCDTINDNLMQAGMFAIRARRKVASERDFLDAVEKVVRQGTKFSSTYVLIVAIDVFSHDDCEQAAISSVQLDICISFSIIIISHESAVM